MTKRSDRGGPNPLCTKGNQARGSDGVPTRGYSSWACSECCEPSPDTWLQPRPNARDSDCLTTGSRPYMVQMACQAEKFPIGMDTLSIEQDGIPGSGRSGIFEPERGEVELPLANAMHQFDA
jgi:hypothetical protein